MDGVASLVATRAVSYQASLPTLIIPSIINAVSFAGLGFLSFYLAGKMHLFDARGHTVSVTIAPANAHPFKMIYQHKAWISLAPLAGASLVAISRTMDYRRKLLLDFCWLMIDNNIY